MSERLYDEQRTERESAERESFTDAVYIPRDQLPNIPRVYARYAEKKRERDENKRSPSRGNRIFLSVLAFLVFCVGGYMIATDGKPPEAAPKLSYAAAPAVGLPHAEVIVLPETPAGSEMPRMRVGKPRLGLIVQTVSQTVAEYYNQYHENALTVGAMVYAADENGCAARAGLRPGDIIIGYEDRLILSSDDLAAAELLYRMRPSVSVTFFREGAVASVFLTPDDDTVERTDEPFYAYCMTDGEW